MTKTARAPQRRISPGKQAQPEPVDEASFMRYYHIAMEAASMEGPVPEVRDRVLPNPEGTPESVLDVVFGDDPLSRMIIAIKNQMSGEGRMDKFRAVSTRILALIRLIGGGSLKRWAISGPHDSEHLYYPDAAISAAAVSPLNDDLTFKMDQFELLLKARIGGLYWDSLGAYVSPLKKT